MNDNWNNIKEYLISTGSDASFSNFEKLRTVCIEKIS